MHLMFLSFFLLKLESFKLIEKTAESLQMFLEMFSEGEDTVGRKAALVAVELS